MTMGLPIGSPELVTIGLVTLVFYLLPYVIATVALLICGGAGVKLAGSGRVGSSPWLPFFCQTVTYNKAATRGWAKAPTHCPRHGLGQHRETNGGEPARARLCHYLLPLSRLSHLHRERHKIGTVERRLTHSTGCHRLTALFEVHAFRPQC